MNTFGNTVYTHAALISQLSAEKFELISVEEMMFAALLLFYFV